MILLQGGPPPPPIPPHASGNTPFDGPCISCVPIDNFLIILIFVALLYAMYKLIHYDDNN